MAHQFVMPIVEPPPSGQTYATLLQNAGMVVVTDSLSDGIVIRLSTTAAVNFPLLSMGKGELWFIPAGMPLTVAAPTGTSFGASGAPTFGGGSSDALLLKLTRAKQVRDGLNPLGIPAFEFVLYENVDRTEVEQALRAQMVPLSDKALEVVTGLNAPRPDLEHEYATLLMAGGASIHVPEAVPIGAAAPDPAIASDVAFTLRLFSLWPIIQTSTGRQAEHPEEINPTLPLRNLAAFGATTAAERQAWHGHPLIEQLVSGTVSLNAHLRFVCWDNNPPAGRKPLPVGTFVRLVMKDGAGTRELDRKPLVADGHVHLEVPDLEQVAGPRPHIWFVVETGGLTLGNRTLPPDAEWSTRGWLAEDTRVPGDYPDFAGTQLGLAVKPVTFHVGVEVHIRYRYTIPASGPSGLASTTVDVPKGTYLQLAQDVDGKGWTLQADDNGKIDNVLLDPPPSPSHPVLVESYIAIEDSSINLGLAMVFDMWGLGLGASDLQLGSILRERPAGGIALERTKVVFRPGASIKLEGTDKIMSPATPWEINCTEELSVAGLYALKVLREWSLFLHHLAGILWPGLEMVINLWAPAAAYSYPIGRINLPEKSHWRRDTIVHELSHQIVWAQTGLTETDVALRYTLLHPGDRQYSMFHASHLLANPGHAFVEGWPSIIEAIFDSTREIPAWSAEKASSPLKKVFLNKLVALNPAVELGPDIDPASFDRGYEVEGAFYNAMYRLFYKLVQDPIPVASSSPVPAGHLANEPHSPWTTGDPMVPEEKDGNIVSGANVANNPSWVTFNDAADRFQRFFFAPLGAMNTSTPTTKLYVGAIKAAVQADPNFDWDVMVAELRMFNMETVLPTIAGVTPATTPLPGGNAVTNLITIDGDGFVQNSTTPLIENTRVRIGTQTATVVKVISGKKLEVVAPNIPTVTSPNTFVDVVVETPAGRFIKSNGLEYV